MRKPLAAILLLATTLGSLGGIARADQAMTPAEHRRLFLKGAELWPVYCNQCHNARPPSEKAPYEWNQIMMHMRTLGNLPPDDAEAILEYLKSGH